MTPVAKKDSLGSVNLRLFQGKLDLSLFIKPPYSHTTPFRLNGLTVVFQRSRRIMCKKELEDLKAKLKKMKPPKESPWFTFRSVKLVMAYLLWKFRLGFQVSKIPDAIDAKLVQMEYFNFSESYWAVRRKSFLTELRREIYIQTAEAFVENMAGEMLW